MVAGSDGSVWLQRHVRAEEAENRAWNPDDPDAAPRTLWREPVLMDMFDRDGLYVGPVRLPDHWVPWRRGRFSPERVILITGHPLGHEQVVAFDLMPGGGGPPVTHP